MTTISQYVSRPPPCPAYPVALATPQLLWHFPTDRYCGPHAQRSIYTKLLVIHPFTADKLQLAGRH
jgi:hypothetical protein